MSSHFSILALSWFDMPSFRLNKNSQQLQATMQRGQKRKVANRDLTYILCVCQVQKELQDTKAVQVKGWQPRNSTPRNCHRFFAVGVASQIQRRET